MSELQIVGELVRDHGWDAGLASGATWFFGPTIVAIRRNIGRWSDFHSANVLGLNKRIQNRIGADGDPGAIHPRVAQQVIENAPWISDGVQQEYLAGLLIASRTADGTSERGAYYARIAASLTGQQTRVHQAVYSTLAGSPPEGIDFGNASTSTRAAVWLPVELLGDILHPEGESVLDEFSEACLALHNLGLTGDFGDPTDSALQGLIQTPSRSGMVIAPTSLGVLLYLWARGLSASDANLLHHLSPDDGPAELTRWPTGAVVAPMQADVPAPY